VGGVWRIQPYNNGVQQPTWIARGIAAAAAHPLGVGDAQYRFTSKAGEVDTVPFGAFRRQLIGKIGSFNEDLLTNKIAGIQPQDSLIRGEGMAGSCNSVHIFCQAGYFILNQSVLAIWILESKNVISISEFRSLAADLTPFICHRPDTVRNPVDI
jgi:hypothetical protein